MDYIFWYGVICGISGFLIWPVFKCIFWCSWFACGDACLVATNLKEGVSAKDAIAGVVRVWLFTFKRTMVDRLNGVYRQP